MRSSVTEAGCGMKPLTTHCLVADSCCCNHGGRCTCSHKKEPQTLDTVPESDSDRDAALQSKGKGSSRTRRRANTTSSEGLLSFDTNGHHKPTYKHAKVSQKCGPYPLHRVNSLHSTSSAGNHSVDNLMQAGSVGDSQGVASPASSGAGETVAQSQRQAKSETTSPLMTGSSSFAQLNGQLPPLDLSGIKYPPYVPNSADFFGSTSEEPIFSAGLSAQPVDWSDYSGLDFSSKTEFSSSYSQPQSYGGYDFPGSEQMPTMTTTSTSGEVSEAEDILSNSLEDFESSYRNSTTSSGFGLSQTHAALLSSTDLTNLEFDDYRFMKVSNKYLTTTPSLAGDEPTLLAGSAGGYGGFTSLEEDPSFWMPEYSGLPSITDSPTDSNLAPYWEVQ